MNDKQKELALEMAVAMVRPLVAGGVANAYRHYDHARELLAAFDAAADAPKRKYTVDDIKLEHRIVTGYWYVKCGEYGWVHGEWKANGWCGMREALARVIYAGLVATGNVPEVGE